MMFKDDIGKIRRLPFVKFLCFGFFFFFLKVVNSAEGTLYFVFHLFAHLTHTGRV